MADDAPPPAPEGKGLPGKAKGIFKKKLGPLPVWGWAVIGVGIGGAFFLMRKRGGASTQGGAYTVKAPESSGGSGGGGGGGIGDITSPTPTSPVSAPGGEQPTPIRPTTPSVDNRPPAARVPSSSAIVAPTPEEIAYAINRRNESSGQERSQWDSVTQEHTQRLAASLQQTPQGRQQLANVTTAYKKDAKAADTFFTECAKNPEGCKRMFGGG